MKQLAVFRVAVLGFLCVGCGQVDPSKAVFPLPCPPVTKPVSLELTDLNTGEPLNPAGSVPTEILKAPTQLQIASDGLAGPVVCSAQPYDAVKFYVFGPFASSDAAFQIGDNLPIALEQLDEYRPFQTVWDVKGTPDTSAWYRFEALPAVENTQDFALTRFVLKVQF